MAAGTFYEPPTGRNGMKPSEFWSATAQEAFRDMQNYPLEGSVRIIDGFSTSILRAPPGSPLKTLIGTYSTVAKDLIECALPYGKVIHDDNSGLDFVGWWGLAPNWLTSPINSSIDSQEWLTGCMLARLNHGGIEVPILLEGDTPAIQTNSTWDPLMTYQESNVYGNMFNSTKPLSNTAPAFTAYVCRENYIASACPTDKGSAFVYKRICDNSPTICGLIDMGLCDPTATGSAGACVTGSSTEYWKCKKGTAATMYEFRTVGVQLDTVIDKNACY